MNSVFLSLHLSDALLRSEQTDFLHPAHANDARGHDEGAEDGVWIVRYTGATPN